MQPNEDRAAAELRPADPPATAAAFQELTLEFTARGEAATITKEARVVEEVIIRKEATERVGTVRDTVRRTEVEVEQVPGTSYVEESTTLSRQSPTTPRT